MLLEVALWLLLVFSWLLAPVVVVEECHALSALVHWGRLLHRHLSRALLYEAMVLVPAVVTIAALLLPFEVAAAGQMAGLQAFAPEQGHVIRIEPATVEEFRVNWILPLLRIVQGQIVAPALAFLAVANVFIYLNLRYEHETRRKNT
jgi:hypothetical protein